MRQERQERYRRSTGAVDPMLPSIPETNQRIVAGGFWHEPGEGPGPHNAPFAGLGSSAAPFDAEGWYARRCYSVKLSRQELTIVARCLSS